MTWRAHFCNFLFFTELLGDSQEGLQYESSSVLAGAGGAILLAIVHYLRTNLYSLFMVVIMILPRKR